MGALAGGLEAPAVIGALDGTVEKLAARKRYAAMRAEVAEREGLTLLAAAEQDGLAQQRLVQQAALPQGARVQREVPEVSQKQWGFDV